MGTIDWSALTGRASRQQGLVTLGDLKHSGVSEAVRRLRVRRGEWVRVHRGVYSMSRRPLSDDDRALAALLALGPEAVLSHQSAARQLRIDVPPFHRTHLTIPWSTRRVALRGVRISRTRDDLGAETVVANEFRVTNGARTLIDLAGDLGGFPLRNALDSALRRGVVTVAELKHRLAGPQHGRRGIPRLRRLLRPYLEGGQVPDSGLESLALEAMKYARVKPELHWNIYDRQRFIAEVDLAWPQVRLCVELDGWEPHGSRDAFENDRARDQALVLLGWTVLRFTWKQVKSRRRAFHAAVAAAHAQCAQRRAG